MQSKLILTVLNVNVGIELIEYVLKYDLLTVLSSQVQGGISIGILRVNISKFIILEDNFHDLQFTLWL